MFLEPMIRFPLVSPRLQCDQRYGVFLSERYIHSANHGEEHSNTFFSNRRRVANPLPSTAPLWLGHHALELLKTLDQKYGMLHKV